MVKGGKDQQADKSNGGEGHNDLLGFLLLRCRPSAQTPLEKRWIFFHEVESDQDRYPKKNAEVHPSLPVLNSPRGKKKDDTHCHGEEGKSEPGLFVKRIQETFFLLM